MKARKIGELKDKINPPVQRDYKWWRSNILTGTVTFTVMLTTFWGIGLFD
jgi:hypothetical protein